MDAEWRGAYPQGLSLCRNWERRRGQELILMMGGIRNDGTVWVAGRMLRIVVISHEQSRHHVINEAGVPAATYIAHAAVEPDHQRPPIVLRN